MATGSKTTVPLRKQELGMGDFQKLFEALYPVREKCIAIGSQLGIDEKELVTLQFMESESDRRLGNILGLALKMAKPLTWADIDEALRSPAVNEPQFANLDYGAGKLQPEVLALYQQAMKRGYVEAALTLLVLVGVAGSGKSLFKCLVLGLPVPEFSPSTALAESAIRSMSISQVVVGDGVEWVIVKPKDTMNMVVQTIKEGVPILESTWEELGHLAFQISRSDSHSLPQVEQGGQGSSQEHSQSQGASHEPDSTLSTEFFHAVRRTNIEANLMDKMAESSTATSQKLMEVDFIYMLDSGGQPPFREMLPHFVRKASAIVLMQKLNETLDFKPTISYREEGRVDQGYTYQLRNEQILYQYVQGIQSHNSKVFVVGTHRDRERECEETRETKNERLLKTFRPVLGKQMELYKVGDTDELLFPVDCKAPKPEDKKTAEEFRKRVMTSCMGEKVKIPLSWFMLDQLLQELAERMEVKVLSIEECSNAAEQILLMPRNVCEAAITYLGELNIVFHAPTILPGFVFPNAQVILDKISELVRCSHALRTNSDDAVPSCMDSSERLEFRDFGQVSSEVLQKAFPSHYRDDLFIAQHLLELLEGLLIAGKLENGKHFIPSLLPDLPVEKIGRASPEHPAPLVIHYQDKWVPVGVMPSLIVYLQNICKWALSQKNGKPSCLYHNCTQFGLPGGKPGNVVVIDSTKFLEIHVRPTLGVGRNLCPEIRESIMTGLQETHKSLHYDSAEAQMGFLCSGKCGNKEPHLATLDDKRETWICSEDENVGTYLDQKQKYWLEQLAKG